MEGRNKSMDVISFFDFMCRLTYIFLELLNENLIHSLISFSLLYYKII